MTQKIWRLIKQVFNRKVIPTSIAWAVFISLVGWVVLALGWWLIANLWWHELIIPGSVMATVRAIFLICSWGVVVYGFFIFWANYNYKQYFKKNKRAYIPLATEAPPLSWSEGLFDPISLTFSTIEHSSHNEKNFSVQKHSEF